MFKMLFRVSRNFWKVKLSSKWQDIFSYILLITRSPQLDRLEDRVYCPKKSLSALKLGEVGRSVHATLSSRRLKNSSAHSQYWRRRRRLLPFFSNLRIRGTDVLPSSDQRSLWIDDSGAGTGCRTILAEIETVTSHGNFEHSASNFQLIPWGAVVSQTLCKKEIFLFILKRARVCDATGSLEI